MHIVADTEPSWEWYRSFLHVLETGSLSAAARAMGLTQPTVGRHIDALESALGLKLFTRSFGGFAPTDAARELGPYAAGIAATAGALRRVASSQGDGVRGTVRITASEIVGAEVLPPILAALRERHPALVIELVLSNEANDLLHREADIAVRMFQPEQAALVAQKVARIELGMFAHARYVAAHGAPRSIEDLKNHAFIGFDRETPFIRRIQARFPMFDRAMLAFRADSDLAQLGALRAGFGIGVCQVPIAARDPDLVRVLAKQFAPPLETWIAMHEDLRDSPRCAATFKALADGLRRYATPQAAPLPEPAARRRRST